MAEENNQEIQSVNLFGDVFLYDEEKDKSECILMKKKQQKMRCTHNISSAIQFEAPCQNCASPFQSKYN